MSLQDTYFTQIAEHSMADFDLFRQSLPKDTIGCYSLDFAPYVIRSIGVASLKKAFTKMIYINEIVVDQSQGTICVFLPNDSNLAEEAISYLKKIPNYKKYVIVIPMRGTLFEKAFEKAGFGESLEIIELPMDVVILEPYLFIVPIPNCFSRLYVEGDIDDLQSIARALVKTEIINGVFPRVVTFGEHSNRVHHLLQEMKAQIGISAFSAQPVFDSLIIIDRSIDLITPLLTQFTYGGLIDETIESTCGLVHLPDEVEYESRDILLSDSDEVFKEIRGFRIREAVEFVQSGIQDIADVGKWLVAGVEMKHFKVQAMKADLLAKKKPFFSLHLSMMSYLSSLKFESETFNDIIRFELETLLGQNPPPLVSEKLLLRDENYTEIIREFCLASVVKHGVPSSPLNAFWLRLVQRFGLDFVNDIQNFERSGLLTSQGSVAKQLTSVAKQITSVAKQIATLQLTIDSFNDVFSIINKHREDEKLSKQFNNDDLGSFYDGYVPLTARLVQTALSTDVDQVQSRAKMLQEMHIPISIPPTKPIEANSENAIIKKILVYVIGGVTSSEIAVIREMGKRVYQGSVEFIVGSTSILTARKLIHDVCPKLKKVDGAF